MEDFADDDKSDGPFGDDYLASPSTRYVIAKGGSNSTGNQRNDPDSAGGEDVRRGDEEEGTFVFDVEQGGDPEEITVASVSFAKALETQQRFVITYGVFDWEEREDSTTFDETVRSQPTSMSG